MATSEKEPRMNEPVTRFAAAVLLAGSAMAANAAVNLSVNSFAYGGNSVNVVSTGTTPATYGGGAGAFAGSLSGAGIFDSPSFITYCVEVEQSFSFGNLTGYTLVSPAAFTQASPAENGWGPNAVAIGNRLGQLLTYALPTATTSANSTALQLAIWNTVYDTDNTLSGGTFADTSAFAATANAFLVGAKSQLNHLDLWVLQSKTNQPAGSTGHQDQLIWREKVQRVPSQEVPEPASM